MTVNELTNIVMNLNREYHRAKVVFTDKATAECFGLVKMARHPNCWVAPNQKPRDTNFAIFITMEG